MTEPTATPLLVLRPGDNVLLTLVEDLDPEETKDMVGKLRESFPGVHFTIVAGVSSVLVQPPQ